MDSTTLGLRTYKITIRLASNIPEGLTPWLLEDRLISTFPLRCRRLSICVRSSKDSRWRLVNSLTSGLTGSGWVRPAALACSGWPKPDLTGSACEAKLDFVGAGESWLVGGFGASRDFRGRSAAALLGFFSRPDSFLAPTAIRFAFGGVGGIKFGGFSLSPDILPSEIKRRKFENSSGSPFTVSGWSKRALTSSMVTSWW